MSTYYQGGTAVINDPGYQPATQWLNGMQVGYPGMTADDNRLGAGDYNALQQQRANAWNAQAAAQWSARQRGDNGQSSVLTGDKSADSLLATIPHAQDLARQYHQQALSAANPQPSFVSANVGGQPYFQVGGEDVTDSAMGLAQGLNLPPEIAARTIQAQRMAAAKAAMQGKSQFDRMHAIPAFAQLSAPQQNAMYRLAEGQTPDDELRDYHYSLRNSTEEAKNIEAWNRANGGGGMNEAMYNHYDTIQRRYLAGNADLPMAEDAATEAEAAAKPPMVHQDASWGVSTSFPFLTRTPPKDVPGTPDPDAVNRAKTKRALFERKKQLVDFDKQTVSGFEQRHGLGGGAPSQGRSIANNGAFNNEEEARNAGYKAGDIITMINPETGRAQRAILH